MSLTQTTLEPWWFDPFVNFCAVLLGALLAWASTWWFEKKKQKEARLVLAYSLFFKIQDITERTIKLNDHISKCLNGPAKIAHEKDAWVSIRNIIGFSHAIQKISPEELALLASCGAAKMVTKIQEIEAGHDIAFDLFDEIQRGREIVRRATEVAGMKGEVVTLQAEREEIQQLAPEIQSLENATVGLVKMLPSVVKEAKIQATAVGPKLKDLCGFKHYLVYES